MPDVKAMTVEDLQGQTCHTPGCTCGGELAFHSACHPESRCHVWWEPQYGTIRVDCGECNKLIARIKLAQKR